MKKFLAIFLALVLCFTASLALASCAEEETGATLDDAVEYLKSAYKSDEGKKTANDYAMPAQVVVEGVTFTITYVVDNAAIKVVYNETKKLYDVDLPDNNAEETPYKLTATVTNAAGESKTLEFGRILPVIEKVSGAVTAPVAETPYKLFMDQKSIAQVLFIIAEADGTQFLKTDKDPKVAPDWYVEVSGDGYKIYTVVNNAKMYMYATAAPRAGEEGKFDKAIALSADNASVFKYKEDINAWYTTINTTPTAEVANNIDFAIGTYGTFKTLCISETSYYTPENTGVEQFPMQFISKAEGEAMTPSEEIADPTTVTSIAAVLAIANAKEHDKYTVEKYLIEGVITEIKSTTYGNMYVSDGNGNTIYVYGLYDDSGETTADHRYDKLAKKPQVGDTVKLMGIVGQYNGTAQMKNAQLKGHTEKQWSDAEKVAAVKAALTVAAVNANDVVDLPLTDATHTSVTIAWALASSYTGNAATLDATTGKLTVTLQNTAETVTLVATIKSGTVTDTKEVTVAVAAKPAEGPVKVAAPVIGQSYKMAMAQAKLGKLLYITGENNGNKAYQLATTEAAASAVSVTLEAVDGVANAFRLYFMNGQTKTYIEMINYNNGASLQLTTTQPTTYFVIDADTGVAYSLVGTMKMYLGTYGTNTYVSASNADTYVLGDKATNIGVSQFPLFFYEVKALTDIAATDKVEMEKVLFNPDIPNNVSSATQITLGNTAKLFEEVVITWTAEGATIVDGKVTLTPAAAAQNVKLTATFTIGTTSATKEFTVTVAAAAPEATVTEKNVAEIAAEAKANSTNHTSSKFYLWINPDNNADRFVTGSLNNKKLTLTDNVTTAVQVYLVYVDTNEGTDRYYLCFDDNGTRKYISWSDGTNFSVGTTAPTDYWTVDTTNNTLMCAIGTRWMRGYNSNGVWDVRPYAASNGTGYVKFVTVTTD